MPLGPLKFATLVAVAMRKAAQIHGKDDAVAAWIIPLAKPDPGAPTPATRPADWVPRASDASTQEAGHGVRESLAWMEKLEARAQAIEGRLRGLRDQHRL